MIVSGNNAVSGNVVSNLTIANGTAFPATPSVGELFFRTDSNTLFIYNNVTWVKLVDNSLSEKQTEDSDLTSIANLTGVTGLLRKTSENNWSIDTNAYITSTIITGDISGSGATNVVLTLPNIVSANTYKSVTVNAKGQVTAGTNPTTLAGFGIIDSAPLSHTTDNSVHLTPAQNTWIDAITATSNEVNYLTGTTSSVQTQLNNKSSSTHTHIAKIGDGASQQLSYDINTERLDIVAGANVILSFNDLTNALTIGTSGTLSGNATTASALYTPRTISITGDATWSTTFDGSTNATGALTLANIATAGTYKSVTVNAKGQVTAGTNPTTLAGYGITNAAPLSHTTDNSVHLTSAQNTWIDAITATSNEINYLIGATWNIQEQLDSKQTYGTGTTLDAGESLIVSSGASITIIDPPIYGTDAVNKNYVDANLTGLSWKKSVIAATTANITLSGTQTIDGVAVVAGNRVLVKDQTNQAENGVYLVDVGPWVRTADMDGTTPLNEFNSAALFVESGTTQTDTGWTQVSNVTTVGTSAIQFTQFNGAAGITAGAGLVKSGNTLDINMGAGIAQLPSDEVGIDVRPSSGLMLTVDGTTSSTLTNAQLSLTRQGTAGTYKSVTVDAFGRITAGSNPNTLAGFGITDAVTSTTFTNHNHAVDTLSDVTIANKSANDLLRWNGSVWVNATLAQIGLVAANTAITPGTYTKVTVDAKGLVTLGGQIFTSSSVAPSTPSFGDEWYNTSTDVLFKFINDGASSSWVKVVDTTISSSVTATANTIVQRTASAGAAFNDITATTLTLSSVIAATGDGTQDIGAVNNKFGTIYGRASSAQYADLAEKYTSDANYVPGTVLAINKRNDSELTKSVIDNDNTVIGVVTTNPGYLLNSDLESEFVVAIALVGRVPCKVTGNVAKGDMMVSNGDGTARAEYTPNKYSVVGRALESFDGDTGTIEIFVTR